MNEEEIFNDLLKRDPTPGIPERLKKCSSKKYIFPGWIFDKEEDVSLGGTSLNILDKLGIRQILYDLLALGLTDIRLRPKCPICGKDSKFISLSKGYRMFCGNKNCISEMSKLEMLSLWKVDSYKDIQSNSHKEWASKNLDLMRQRSLSLWNNPDYREIQSNSHKEWASKEENLMKMREATLKAWSNPEYRKTQIDSHKRFALENPDKIKLGNGGIIECSKSEKGFLNYDSSWEKLFIEYSQELDIIKSIDRAGVSIPYDYFGDIKRYFPDFKVILTNGKCLMIEIKANWMIEFDDKTPLKLEAGRTFTESSLDFDDYLVFTEDILFNGQIKEENFNKNLITELLEKYI